MEQPVSKAATSTGTTDTLTAHDPDPVDTHEVIDLVGSLLVDFTSLLYYRLTHYRSMNRPGRDNYHGSSANAFVRFNLDAISFHYLISFKSTFLG